MPKANGETVTISSSSTPKTFPTFLRSSLEHSPPKASRTFWGNEGRVICTCLPSICLAVRMPEKRVVNSMVSKAGLIEKTAWDAASVACPQRATSWR